MKTETTNNPGQHTIRSSKPFCVFFFSCMRGKEKFLYTFTLNSANSPSQLEYSTKLKIKERKKKKHFNLTSVFFTFRLYRELNTEDLAYIFPREKNWTLG